MPYFSMAIRSSPRPKAKPEYLFRIVPDVLKDRRIHHSGPENLKPAALAANPAARAPAHHALDIHLGARFGKGEKTGAESQSRSPRRISAARKTVRMPFRSPKVMPLSTSSPSI